MPFAPDDEIDDELADALIDLLSDGLPHHAWEVAEELRGRGLDLGDDGEAEVAAAVDDDLVPLAMWLPDGRLVHLPALLAGRTVTHRLRRAEIDHDLLEVSPDLEPIALLIEEAPHDRLADGTPIEPVLAEGRWRLAPGTLTALGAGEGDLLAVTVGPTGLELSLLPEAPAAGELPARFVELLARYGAGQPMDIGALAWQLCVEDDAFGTPRPPVTEGFAATGLVTRHDRVAPAGFSFEEWITDHRRQRLLEAFDLREDEVAAVLELADLHRAVADGEIDPDDLDRAAVGSALDALAEPYVAEALLEQVLGTQADAEDVEGLTRLATSLLWPARLPSRPSLHWLHGRAREWAGDVLAAEQAFGDALDIDPDCRPALLDLARYAADRGDADRALGLLGRAEDDEQHPLVAVLERYRATERTDVGRNDPCWCGSGRKYKVCHRGRVALSAADHAAWLHLKARLFLGEPRWYFQRLEVALARAGHLADDDLWQALTDPLVDDALLAEDGLLGTFLDDRGVLLPVEERALAERWLTVRRSVHEVEAVRPGAGFTARDLRTGERYEVEEPDTDGLVPGTLVCARFHPVDTTTATALALGGWEPVHPDAGEALLSLLDAGPSARDLVAALTP